MTSFVFSPLFFFYPTATLHTLVIIKVSYDVKFKIKIEIIIADSTALAEMLRANWDNLEG